MNILVFLSRRVKVIGVCHDKKFYEDKWRWKKIKNSDFWITLFTLVIIWLLLCSFTPYQSSLGLKEVYISLIVRTTVLTPMQVGVLFVLLWFVLLLIGLSSLRVGKLNKCYILSKSYPFFPIRLSKQVDIAKTRLTSMRC